MDRKDFLKKASDLALLATGAATEVSHIFARTPDFPQKNAQMRKTSKRQSVEKPSESSRGPKPSRTSNRAQRRVRWGGCLPERQASRFATGKAKSKISLCCRRDDFCGGKSHFPEQKSFPCRFCTRGFRRNPSKICEAENPKGFQVSPMAKLPTAKLKILTRHLAGELAPPSTSLSKLF